MNLLIILLPLISVILWTYLFYNWTKKFLSKESNWYIFFSFLFIFMMINFMTFLLYWFVWFFNVSDMSNINALWLSLILWLPMLWSSMWMWISWKYLFSFIQKFTSKWWMMTKMMFFLFFLFFIIAMSYWTILWLIIFLKHMNDLSFWTWLILWNGYLMWFSWFWMWMWFWLMISWLLMYMEKLFSKDWLTTIKKIKYIMLNMLFYMLLYNLITFSMMYSLMVSFKLFELQNLDFSQYISSWLMLWIIWMFVTFLQWYLFFNYHNKSKNMLLTIVWFILLHLLWVWWLVMVFNMISY